jgi:HEAT repeat protein
MVDDTRMLGDRLRAGDSSVVGELVRRGAREQLRRGLACEHDLVREEALAGLARLRDPRDLALIVDLLGDPAVGDAAQLAAQDFGPAAVEPLVAKLRTDEDAALCAIEALGAVGDRRAVGPLEQTAIQHPCPISRRFAREALERLSAG